MRNKIVLQAPDHIDFSTDIKLQISDINYGQHLANDAVLRLAHEARLQFLAFLGYTEMNVEGAALIMTDAAIQYLNQAGYGETLRIDVSILELYRTGFTLYYSFFSRDHNQEVARVQINMAFFNYERQKVTRCPPAFTNTIYQHQQKPIYC